MTTRTIPCRRTRAREVGSHSCTAFAALIGVIALTACAGCATFVYDEPGPRHSPRACSIPPGHLPPPGECRVWYPDRSPGQQPPPGDCHELRRHVPAGACLVYGE